MDLLQQAPLIPCLFDLKWIVSGIQQLQPAAVGSKEGPASRSTRKQEEHGEDACLYLTSSIVERWSKALLWWWCTQSLPNRLNMHCYLFAVPLGSSSGWQLHLHSTNVLMAEARALSCKAGRKQQRKNNVGSTFWIRMATQSLKKR